MQSTDRIAIAKLTLTDFRNYRAATLLTGAGPVVLAGANGAGKTNCLEAVSLLTAGRGLRSLPFPELARSGGSGGWAVAAELGVAGEDMHIGTGIQLPPDGMLTARAARTVKIDHALAKGSGALARIRMLWLTPSMDGLFTGPAADRRRFLDRLVLSLDPGYAAAAAAFERAMRQRNKALEEFDSPPMLTAIEAQMAEAAVAMAVARARAVSALSAEIEAERARDPDSLFPWAALSLVGTLEEQAGALSEDAMREGYVRSLAHGRDRDRAAGRTLAGPHRSDLDVTHGPKAMPARMCSTGEQKALLVGLVLAQARLIKRAAAGIAPLILLDEIAAHLDIGRREALFSSIVALNAQVWMTGTDLATFTPLRSAIETQLFVVSNGSIMPANDAERAAKH
ncbi:DNA replication/repair protein RecF [Rhodomicrobium lacus]|uniref:DNA replication/repair protein RecF n=1 Tax=Rhodomicrobium lacus TaxID=2498452 RepID=UPI0026E44309|nr:DNA replication/repair protein RecF [Rhodomicrobium lacus]WKW50918.1 DNA replication/repair protein RecF [Rhodomicrobium lacus]